MNILLLHKQDEDQDYIDIATRIFESKGQVSSLREDQSLYMTNDRSTWLRDCASGFSIYGKPRYDVFVVIGKYLDKVILELLSMIDNKSVYYISGSKVLQLLPEQVNTDTMEIEQ